jgi:hypothetical protein
MPHADCVGNIIEGMKESAMKQSLRRVQWTLYALAPIFLAFGYHTMGKRWW